MAHAEHFAVLVVGSGAGGKLLAAHMAGNGRRMAVVERKYIGGSCPNINCLPSKNEVKSANVADTVRRAGAFGTAVSGARTDMAQVLARKRSMVEGLVQMHLELFRSSGVDLVLGQAHFVAPRTVEVTLNGGGARVMTGDRLFLNLGTRPHVAHVPGLPETALTNIELLELDRYPVVWAAAGRPDAVFEITTARLKELSRAVVADLAER